MSLYKEKMYQYSVDRLIAAHIRQKFLNNHENYRAVGKQLAEWYRGGKSAPECLQDLQKRFGPWNAESLVKSLQAASGAGAGEA